MATSAQTFPITYLLDRLAPSETFIQREIEQLRSRNWPLEVRLIGRGIGRLRFSFSGCPAGSRVRFLRAACRRLQALAGRSPMAALRLLRRLPQAAELTGRVLENESRLIHAHFAGITADVAAVAAAAAGIPWSCSVHARDVFTVPSELTACRLIPAAGVMACSRLAAERVAAAGVPPERIALVHHGLHLNDFPYDTVQPDGVFFTACRLEPKKGLDTLLHACAILKRNGVDFSCVIAGDGPERGALETLAAKLNLRDRVEWIGWQSQEETRSLLMDATLLVLPSRVMPNGDRDGIANVLLEAMAIGTPVLTTPAGAAAEIITDGVNGLLVQPDDPAALAAALGQALVSKQRLMALAHEARRTIEAQFDATRTTRQVEDFLFRVIGATA
ncbi:MAG: glycosyltransferase [Kiritimatiellae bacterium]|nr:glycosyltransferase [Kiritimatiellia bacterium]MBP5226159.1 glycosyltransferase [Kiritimatiellia bacterium]